MGKARRYLTDLRASLKWLDAAHDNDGARRRQFEIKRQVVKTLVEKVLVEKDRTLRVVFYLDVATLLQRVGVTAEIDSVGIYSHRRSARLPPLP